MELADEDFKRYYKYTQGFKEKCEYGRWGMKVIKKNQIERLELKNTIPERKNSLAGFNTRLDMVEKKKKVCDIEDITKEPIQTKAHREKA